MTLKPRAFLYLMCSLSGRHIQASARRRRVSGVRGRLLLRLSWRNHLHLLPCEHPVRLPLTSKLMDIYLYIYIYVHRHMLSNICVKICMYIYIHIYIHTYICIYASARRRRVSGVRGRLLL